MRLLEALRIIDKLIDAAGEAGHSCLRDDMADHNVWLAKLLAELLKERDNA